MSPCEFVQKPENAIDSRANRGIERHLVLNSLFFVTDDARFLTDISADQYFRGRIVYYFDVITHERENE